MAEHNHSPCVLDRILADLACRVIFHLCARRESQTPGEFLCLCWISQHSKDVYHPAEFIVADFDLRTRLSKQDTSGSQERLDIDAVGREVADHPFRKPPLTAV